MRRFIDISGSFTSGDPVLGVATDDKPELEPDGVLGGCGVEVVRCVSTAYCWMEICWQDLIIADDIWYLPKSG